MNADKVLSVEEAASILQKNILGACFDYEDIEVLISAVQREQDEIATKRERERAVDTISDFFTNKQGERIYNFFVFHLTKKILEENKNG